VQQSSARFYLPIPISFTPVFAGSPIGPRKGAAAQGVPMVLAVFDVDCEASHKASGGGGEAQASDLWWQGQMAKLKVLTHVHPDSFAYRTRGGYRLVYFLPEPHFLRSPDDAALWSFSYLTWCAYLAGHFDIQADPSCKDWQRLYRLPHATRTPGGHPEKREMLGDPRHIGIWHCEPAAEDVVTSRTLSKRTLQATHKRGRSVVSVGAGKGLLYYAFQARGWVGQWIDPGKVAVACPWEERHTKGERFDTSTIIFAPSNGGALGWFHGSHAHCQGRNFWDVLALFTPAELAHARAATGLLSRDLNSSSAASGYASPPPLRGVYRHLVAPVSCRPAAEKRYV
jgi:hypothetical protein